MNKTEILAMSSGIELDHMIMKEIFNATKKYYGEEENWYHLDSQGEPDYEWSCYNRPSTDISASWEVVGEMGERGWMIYKLAHKLSSDSAINGFTCTLLNIQTGASREVVANTAQEAICKCALLTLTELE